ncbi:MAG: M48 family metalloprotease [Bacteriodetes bacterium]|nr:M48 family metalloprotease [Bacteroidota bacterium]
MKPYKLALLIVCLHILSMGACCQCPTTLLSESSTKNKKEIEELLRTIHYYSGYGDVPLPTFCFRPEPDKYSDRNGKEVPGAYYDGDRSIVIYEKLYNEVKQKFGTTARDAFAYVIAHELAHYFHNHNTSKWINGKLTLKLSFGFATAHLTDMQGVAVNDTNNSRLIVAEHDADATAAMWCYRAGFNLKKVSNEMEYIYSTYNLPDNDLVKYGYLPLRIRKKGFSEDILKMAQQAAHLLSFIEYAVAVQDWSTAQMLFKYLDKYEQAWLRTPEIENMWGVMLAQWALTEMSKNGFASHLHYAYCFPFTMQQPSLSTSKGSAEEITALLDSAEHHCSTAIKNSDSTYTAAYINMGLIAVLQNNLQKAKRWLQDVHLASIPDEQLAALHIARGIYALQVNKTDIETALNLFKQAKFTLPVVAENNVRLLTTTSIPHTALSNKKVPTQTFLNWDKPDTIKIFLDTNIHTVRNKMDTLLIRSYLLSGNKDVRCTYCTIHSPKPKVFETMKYKPSMVEGLQPNSNGDYEYAEFRKKFGDSDMATITNGRTMIAYTLPNNEHHNTLIVVVNNDNQCIEEVCQWRNW